jgi:hypothetical protein
MFVLQNELASGGLILHWLPRTRQGVNLGPSPTHTRNINLVLKNLHKGCVSPQFQSQYLMISLRNCEARWACCQRSVSMAKLSGLVAATQAPSLEYHDESMNPLEQVSQTGTVPTSVSESTAPTRLSLDYNNG